MLLCLWSPLPDSVAGGAGARPDHPISGLHCSAFAPIIYLEGLRKPREAFWGSQASVNWRGHSPSATELTNLFAFCTVPMEPNASWRVSAPRTRRRGRIHLSRRGSHHEASQKHNRDQPMNTADKLYRFAAECEFMAKLTHNPKNKTIWAHMAERWIRCAELFDRQSSAAEPDGSMKRHRKATHHWAH